MNSRKHIKIISSREKQDKIKFLNMQTSYITLILQTKNHYLEVHTFRAKAGKGNGTENGSLDKYLVQLECKTEIRYILGFLELSMSFFSACLVCYHLLFTYRHYSKRVGSPIKEIKWNKRIQINGEK